MPSMDIVSKLDLHELSNSVDQTNREIDNRFDFKGSDAKIELSENVMTILAAGDFQIKQILDVLYKKLVKRGVSLECLDYGKIETSGKMFKQLVTAREGIEMDIARKIVKEIKQSKTKVQASIQQDQVRVSGKKRDDLQAIIAMMKASDLGLPLQFINFRD